MQFMPTTSASIHTNVHTALTTPIQPISLASNTFTANNNGLKQSSSTAAGIAIRSTMTTNHQQLPTPQAMQHCPMRVQPAPQRPISRYINIAPRITADASKTPQLIKPSVATSAVITVSSYSSSLSTPLPETTTANRKKYKARTQKPKGRQPRQSTHDKRATATPICIPQTVTVTYAQDPMQLNMTQSVPPTSGLQNLLPEMKFGPDGQIDISDFVPDFSDLKSLSPTSVFTDTSISDLNPPSSSTFVMSTVSVFQPGIPMTSSTSTLPLQSAASSSINSISEQHMSSTVPPFMTSAPSNAFILPSTEMLLSTPTSNCTSTEHLDPLVSSTPLESNAITFSSDVTNYSFITPGCISSVSDVPPVHPSLYHYPPRPSVCNMNAIPLATTTTSNSSFCAMSSLDSVIHSVLSSTAAERCKKINQLSARNESPTTPVAISTAVTACSFVTTETFSTYANTHAILSSSENLQSQSHIPLCELSDEQQTSLLESFGFHDMNDVHLDLPFFHFDDELSSNEDTQAQPSISAIFGETAPSVQHLSFLDLLDLDVGVSSSSGNQSLDLINFCNNTPQDMAALDFLLQQDSKSVSVDGDQSLHEASIKNLANELVAVAFEVEKETSPEHYTDRIPEPSTTTITNGSDLSTSMDSQICEVSERTIPTESFTAMLLSVTNEVAASLANSTAEFSSESSTIISNEFPSIASTESSHLQICSYNGQPKAFHFESLSSTESSQSENLVECVFGLPSPQENNPNNPDPLSTDQRNESYVDVSNIPQLEVMTLEEIDVNENQIPPLLDPVPQDNMDSTRLCGDEANPTLSDSTFVNADDNVSDTSMNANNEASEMPLPSISSTSISISVISDNVSHPIPVCDEPIHESSSLPQSISTMELSIEGAREESCVPTSPSKLVNVVPHMNTCQGDSLHIEVVTPQSSAANISSLDDANKECLVISPFSPTSSQSISLSSDTNALSSECARICISKTSDQVDLVFANIHLRSSELGGPEKYSASPPLTVSQGTISSPEVELLHCESLVCSRMENVCSLSISPMPSSLSSLTRCANTFSNVVTLNSKSGDVNEICSSLLSDESQNAASCPISDVIPSESIICQDSRELGSPSSSTTYPMCASSPKSDILQDNISFSSDGGGVETSYFSHKPCHSPTKTPESTVHFDVGLREPPSKMAIFPNCPLFCIPNSLLHCNRELLQDVFQHRDNHISFDALAKLRSSSMVLKENDKDHVYCWRPSYSSDENCVSAVKPVWPCNTDSMRLSLTLNVNVSVDDENVSLSAEEVCSYQTHVNSPIVNSETVTNAYFVENPKLSQETDVSEESVCPLSEEMSLPHNQIEKPSAISEIISSENLDENTMDVEKIAVTHELEGSNECGEIFPCQSHIENLSINLVSIAGEISRDSGMAVERSEVLEGIESDDATFVSSSVSKESLSAIPKLRINQRTLTCYMITNTSTSDSSPSVDTLGTIASCDSHSPSTSEYVPFDHDIHEVLSSGHMRIIIRRLPRVEELTTSSPIICQQQVTPTSLAASLTEKEATIKIENNEELKQELKEVLRRSPRASTQASSLSSAFLPPKTKRFCSTNLLSLRSSQIISSTRASKRTRNPK